MDVPPAVVPLCRIGVAENFTWATVGVTMRLRNATARMPGSLMRGLSESKEHLPLEGNVSTPNPPLFPCRAEQPLSEIEPLLCFHELLLDVQEGPFQYFQALDDIGCRCLRTMRKQPSNPDDGEGSDPYGRQERDKLF